MKKTVIFGNNVIAEMIHRETIQYGSDLEIVAFTVDEAYRKVDSFCGLPMVDFKKALSLYPPSDFYMLSSLDSMSILRGRMNIFEKIKSAGYAMPNYISKLSDTPKDTIMGENNIILAFAHIGVHGKMGNYNTIRQNTYLGHGFEISDGTIITAGNSIGGCCRIGNLCYFGLGAVTLHSKTIADETLIGAGAVVTKDTDPYTKYVGNPARPIGTHEDTGIIFKVKSKN